GAVASRIGAVRGDLVGVDILERGAGRAIDELVVELPHAGLVDLMISEVNQVDGVDVEDVREAPGSPVDPRLDALETAAYLVERGDPGDLLRALVSHAARDFEADWAAVVDPVAPRPLNSVGSMPPDAWVFAFVKGARSSLVGKDGGAASPTDVAWADLSVASLVVVLGRDGRPFRTRERRQLSALARIADSRWVEIVTRVGTPPELGRPERGVGAVHAAILAPPEVGGAGAAAEPMAARPAQPGPDVGHLRGPALRPGAKRSATTPIAVVLL
ncbi:MAG TPA: hypothetical protein VEJ84_02860, partial [Acidimicrobiales bacterium]|nr:hypothetical protein [Acidimicrobiales bacterium]